MYVQDMNGCGLPQPFYFPVIKDIDQRADHDLWSSSIIEGIHILIK